MAYSISNIKADLSGTLHGTTTNQITGLNNLINRAARQFLLDLDPQETIRIVAIGTPINNDQFEYAAPADLKGDKVIDIRPQVNRQPNDIFLQRYNQQFDVQKDWTLQSNFTVNFNTSQKSLRINAPNIDTGIVLNQADAIADSGTWVTGGSASNLSQDTVNFVSGSGSLSFDVAVGANPSTAYLENSTFTAIDLTDHYLQSLVYFWVYLPDASNFTNVIIRWGSSLGDYWTSTQTQTAEGTTFQNGWNLVAAPWATAASVGAPDPSAVDYLRVTYTYDGTQMAGVHLNQIVSRKGFIYNVEYYSKYLFRDANTGVFQETVTDDTNLINLDTESYDIFFNQVALLCVQQAFGTNAGYDTTFFVQKYIEGIKRYKNMYKAQIQKPQATYYQTPTPGYAQYFGRPWR